MKFGSQPLNQGRNYSSTKLILNKNEMKCSCKVIQIRFEAVQNGPFIAVCEVLH